MNVNRLVLFSFKFCTKTCFQAAEEEMPTKHNTNRFLSSEGMGTVYSLSYSN